MSQTRINEIRKMLPHVFEEAQTIVQGAHAMCRDLNDEERARFQTKTEEYDHLSSELRSLEDAEPEGRHPREWLADLADLHFGPKTPNLLQERLEIQKRKGEALVQAIAAHDAEMRARDTQSRYRKLDAIAAEIQHAQRVTQRRAQLDIARRRAQLTDTHYPEA